MLLEVMALGRQAVVELGDVEATVGGEDAGRLAHLQMNSKNLAVVWFIYTILLFTHTISN